MDATREKYINNTEEDNQIRKQHSAAYSSSGPPQAVDAAVPWAAAAAVPMDTAMAAMTNLDQLEEALEMELRSAAMTKSQLMHSAQGARRGATAAAAAAGRADSSTAKAPSNTSSMFVSKTYPFSSALPVIVRDLYVLFCRLFLFTIHNSYIHVTGGVLCAVVGNVLHEMTGQLDGSCCLFISLAVTLVHPFISSSCCPLLLLVVPMPTSASASASLCRAAPLAQPVVMGENMTSDDLETPISKVR